ncbi:MAG: alginate O-acetyltransferase complex protein AlgI [Blastocatellia bacterium]|jgi:alginate O-acetyltransferase complex protein AlgI|nr:alginate O-acetyltransferase complex protein AlgI [Blastocatellia bacterium]
MLFTEPVFVFLFLPLVLGLYFIAPIRIRNPLLLAASLLFYFYGEDVYTTILLFSVVLNYAAALALERWSTARTGRLVLFVSVGINLLLLASFKYAVFFVSNLNRILRPLSGLTLPVRELHLPIGISFFTFMGISYLVDVYRRQLKPQTNLTNFALYLTLFPHLIAGPIVRFGDIAKELTSRRVTRTEFVAGLRRFTVGFGKKMILANALAISTDKIFLLDVHQLTPGIAWLGLVCYSLQIYYDFSGYTDMAIGLAMLFGFHFPENFNYPYISRSITEFWRRWHISLSTWFRDYLFFPLGIRGSQWRVCFNLLIVFFLCGLWHGARAHFVVWGLYHGAFLVFERVIGLRWLEKIPRPLQHVYALLIIMLGWIFFYQQTMGAAFNYLKVMFGIWRASAPMFLWTHFVNPELIVTLIFAVVGSAPSVKWLRRWHDQLTDDDTPITILIGSGFRLIRVAAIMIIFLYSAALSAAGTYTPFIYFRF